MKTEQYIKPTFWLTLAGISINLLLISITKIFHLPVYLDSIGTIISAALGGIIPGIAAGFFSNCLATATRLSPDLMTMYYGFLNVMIAVLTVYFTRKNVFAGWKGRLRAIISYALIGGGLGAVVTWFLYGYSYGQGVTKPMVLFLDKKMQLPPFFIQFFGDVTIDLLDKVIVVAAACIILRLMPVAVLKKMPYGRIYTAWKKRDENKDDGVQMLEQTAFRKTSINSKITFWVVFTAGLLTVVSLLIGGLIYYSSIHSFFDASMVRTNVSIYLIRMGTMLFGLMILISVTTIWYCNRYLLEPISILAEQAMGMAYAGNKKNKRVRDENTISTGDELEDVFKAMCDTEDKIILYVEELKQKNHEISKMQRNIIFTLANMVENRDSNTGGHIRRTAKYVKLIGNELRREGIYTQEITKQYIKKLYDSAPLHDIGKIKISDSILNKPGKLTPEEYEIIKTHTTEGGRILKNSLNEIGDDSWLSMAIDMAMYHHEKWNGTGYPNGLKGTEIPLCARIMAVADVFDALVSERSYKKAFSFEQAIQVIEEGAGEHFDPEIVSVFVQSKNEVKKILKEAQ